MPARSFISSASSATPEEAAAIVAALERFMRATAPPARQSAPAQLDAWRVAAIEEGVERDPRAGAGAWLDAPR